MHSSFDPYTFTSFHRFNAVVNPLIVIWGHACTRWKFVFTINQMLYVIIAYGTLNKSFIFTVAEMSHRLCWLWWTARTNSMAAWQHCACAHFAKNNNEMKTCQVSLLVWVAIIPVAYELNSYCDGTWCEATNMSCSEQHPYKVESVRTSYHLTYPPFHLNLHSLVNVHSEYDGTKWVYMCVYVCAQYWMLFFCFCTCRDSCRSLQG